MDIFGYVIEISKRLEKADVYFGHGTDNSIDEAAYIICGSLNICLLYTSDAADE